MNAEVLPNVDDGKVYEKLGHEDDAGSPYRTLTAVDDPERAQNSYTKVPF